MIPQSFICPMGVVLAIALFGASVISQRPAFAQSGARTSTSPAAPLDTSKPSFDTASPSYGGIRPEERVAGTIVAEVDGRGITLSEVTDRIKQMPANIANLPYEILFPNMVEQLVRREALALRAQRRGYDEDPVVRRRVKAAADEVLASETIRLEAEQTVTEARLLERYRRDFADKPGPEEVRVRVISTAHETAARGAIDRLNGGADFAALAKEVSKDPSASLGGDLGFLGREDLNPEIGAVAFVLSVGSTTAYPVRSAGSWFVVRVEERRFRPTPPYAAMKEAIRIALLREAAGPILRSALADVTVREYDVSGKEFLAEPNATP